MYLTTWCLYVMNEMVKKSHLVFPNIAMMFLATRHTNPDWTVVISRFLSVSRVPPMATGPVSTMHKPPASS